MASGWTAIDTTQAVERTERRAGRCCKRQHQTSNDKLAHPSSLMEPHPHAEQTVENPISLRRSLYCLAEGRSFCISESHKMTQSRMMSDGQQRIHPLEQRPSSMPARPLNQAFRKMIPRTSTHPQDCPEFIQMDIRIENVPMEVSTSSLFHSFFPYPSVGLEPRRASAMLHHFCPSGRLTGFDVCEPQFKM